MAFDPSGGLTGWDLTGFHEGHDTECWKRLGAHEVTTIDRLRAGRDLRHPVLGLGAERPGRPAGRRLQLLERRRTPTCTWSRARASGRCSSRGSAPATSTSSRSLGTDGVWRLKADPMARFAEAAPHTASIVYETQYTWGDDQWMWYRGQKKQYQEPMSVYEVHIGSWRKGLTYLELAERAGRVLLVAGLHPRRVPARRPAPVRGLVGLPRHRLLRADVEVRLPR